MITAGCAAVAVAGSVVPDPSVKVAFGPTITAPLPLLLVISPFVSLVSAAVLVQQPRVNDWPPIREIVPVLSTVPPDQVRGALTRIVPWLFASLKIALSAAS